MANNLDQYRTDQEKVLRQQQESAKRAAYLNQQKLLKYLPQRTAGQSVGMTETAKIAANNAYQQNVAAADAVFAEGMNDLNNYVRTEQERLDDKAKAEQDAAYNEIMTTIDSQSWNTTAELKNYLFGEDGQSGVAAGLSDSQRAQVQQRLDFYRNNRDQQAADENYYKTHNADGTVKPAQVNTKNISIGGVLKNMQEGNNFKIDGYKVELGEKVVETGLGNDKNSSFLPSDILQTTADGEVFEYDGQLYYRSSFKNVDGKVIDRIFKVRGRGGSDTEDYKSALALYT